MCNPSTLTIRADKDLPLPPHIEATTTGIDPEVIHYYERDIGSISAVVSIHIAVLAWLRKKQKREKQKEEKYEDSLAKKKTSGKTIFTEPQLRELYIYVRGIDGRIRSVYLANKIHTFLLHLGFSSDVHHLELSRKNPKK